MTRLTFDLTPRWLDLLWPDTWVTRLTLDLTPGWLDLLLTWHLDNLTYFWPDTWVTWLTFDLTSGLLDLLLTWHLGDLTYFWPDTWVTRLTFDLTPGWLDLLLTWHLDDLTYFWPDIWVTWLTFDLTPGWPDLLLTCRSVSDPKRAMLESFQSYFLALINPAKAKKQDCTLKFHSSLVDPNNQRPLHVIPLLACLTSNWLGQSPEESGGTEALWVPP